MLQILNATLDDVINCHQLFIQQLKEIPESLPDSLKKISLEFFYNMTKFPKLPDGLKELRLNYIRLLPESLPSSLEKISIENSNNVTKLPKLPKKKTSSFC